MKIVLIVAGTNLQFIHRINQIERESGKSFIWSGGGIAHNGQTEYRFINSHQNMLGYRGVKVEILAGAHVLRDFQEIKRQVLYCEIPLQTTQESST